MVSVTNYTDEKEASGRLQLLRTDLQDDRVTFDELLRAELAAHGASPGNVFLEGSQHF
jgi:hypothetical protein